LHSDSTPPSPPLPSCPADFSEDTCDDWPDATPADDYWYLYEDDEDDILYLGQNGVGKLNWWRSNGLCEDGQESVSGNRSPEYKIHIDQVGSTDVTVGGITYLRGQTYEYIPCQLGMDCHDCGFRIGVNTAERRRKLGANEITLPPPWNSDFIEDLIALKAAGANITLPAIYTALVRVRGLSHVKDDPAYFRRVYSEEVLAFSRYNFH